MARLRRHCNLLQLQRYHGCLPYTEDKLLEICRQHYADGQKLCKNLEAVAPRPVDFYTILAGYILLKRFQETSELVGTGGARLMGKGWFQIVA